jgi:hypothetical protein
MGGHRPHQDFHLDHPVRMCQVYQSHNNAEICIYLHHESPASASDSALAALPAHPTEQDVSVNP